MSNSWRPGILPNLGKADRNAVTDLVEIKTLDRHSTIFSAGQQPKGVYFLETGKVKIYALGNEGKQQIIHIAGPGELIGYRAMFSGEKYKVYAETLEACRIGFLSQDEFVGLMDKNRNLRDAVLRELAKELGERAVFVTHLAQQTVRQRLASSLLALSELYGEEPINLTREDLANYVGTATESLIRLLKEFREEGLIEVQTRKLIVKERAKLLLIIN